MAAGNWWWNTQSQPQNSNSWNPMGGGGLNFGNLANNLMGQKTQSPVPLPIGYGTGASNQFGGAAFSGGSQLPPILPDYQSFTRQPDYEDIMGVPPPTSLAPSPVMSNYLPEKTPITTGEETIGPPTNNMGGAGAGGAVKPPSSFSQYIPEKAPAPNTQPIYQEAQMPMNFRNFNPFRNVNPSGNNRFNYSNLARLLSSFAGNRGGR